MAKQHLHVTKKAQKKHMSSQQNITWQSASQRLQISIPNSAQLYYKNFYAAFQFGGLLGSTLWIMKWRNRSVFHVPIPWQYNVDTNCMGHCSFKTKIYQITFLLVESNSKEGCVCLRPGFLQFASFMSISTNNIFYAFFSSVYHMYIQC